ncbi:hypothetical protein RRG08_048888 [Elysia crispata]|uniref:Tetraspanin n=1 Tax=Elysia crispata TaxID=231223 RepID=A0AAE1D4D8_9GAST|nr:hypothetical protein RRG08_048888 [Elysia crispata]
MSDGDDSGGCSSSMATIWLVVFNSIFALLGMGIATLGFLLRFNSQLFETYILDILTSAEVDGVDLKAVIESVAIVVIAIGFIIALVALMGCLGGCCQVRTLLVVYSLIMLKLLIIEVVAVILFLVMRDQIDKRVKTALQATLDTFKGYNSTEPVTAGWNYVFTQFDCCGIDSYTDLATATDWIQTVTISGSSYNLTSPVFCCKLVGKFPDITIPSNLDCATAPNATTSNYMLGCYQAVEDYIMGYRIALIVGVALLITCQIITLIATCILKRQRNQVGSS